MCVLVQLTTYPTEPPFCQKISQPTSQKLSQSVSQSLYYSHSHSLPLNLARSLTHSFTHTLVHSHTHLLTHSITPACSLLKKKFGNLKACKNFVKHHLEFSEHGKRKVM
jgi:hypothetical protein